jgi:hypothetical protein
VLLHSDGGREDLVDEALASRVGELCRIIARSAQAGVRCRPAPRPGFILFVQTFGDLVNFNPHVHALVVDGVFEASGRFIPLPLIPEALLAERLRRKVLGLLVRRKVILPPLASQMLTWRHSGFSTRHYWTFRARYRLDGQVQVTRWAFSAAASSTTSRRTTTTAS